MELHHEGHEGTQRPTKENAKDSTPLVIGCSMRVHTALGAGLLESIYEECLCREFKQAGIKFERQTRLPLFYKGAPLPSGLRVDLLVEESVIVEVKSVETILPIHEAQLLTYLRLSGKRIGLLLNFNVAHMRHGIRRRVV